MIQIETIARLLLELNVSFNYDVRQSVKQLEVLKNGRIKPFFVASYPDRQKLYITNSKQEETDINDLMKAINSLFIEPAT